MDNTTATNREWIEQAARIAARHVGMPVVATGQVSEGFLAGPFMAAVRMDAWSLLQNARILSMGTGTEDAFTDALRWLAEVAEEYGFLHGCEPTTMPPEPDWGDSGDHDSEAAA